MLMVRPLYVLAAVMMLTCFSSSFCFADTYNNRTITFTNSGKNTIYIGINGGSVLATSGGTIDCSDSNTCPNGTHCETQHNLDNTQKQLCIWDHPVPGGVSISNANASNYKLQPNESKQAVIVVQGERDDRIMHNAVWSGSMWARTNCKEVHGQLYCESGHCPTNTTITAGNATCMTLTANDTHAHSVGPIPPFTKLETTMLYDSQDTYDLSLVDGANSRIEYGPSEGQSLKTAPPNSGYYWCQNPGGKGTGHSQPDCDWKFNMPTTSDAVYYRHVSGEEGDSSYTSCTSDASCSSGQVCGLILQSSNKITRQPRCGTFLGYFTPGQVCNNWGSGENKIPFDCGGATTDVNGTNTNLYLCHGDWGTTCYPSSPTPGDTTCCGCSNWSDLGVSSLNPQCIASQQGNWYTTAYPKFYYFKAACPTAYVYQYDDKSSTFTCATAGVNNTASYTITYSDLSSPTPIQSSPSGDSSSSSMWEWANVAVVGAAIFGGLWCFLDVFFQKDDTSSSSFDSDLWNY